MRFECGWSCARSQVRQPYVPCDRFFGHRFVCNDSCCCCFRTQYIKAIDLVQDLTSGLSLMELCAALYRGAKGIAEANQHLTVLLALLPKVC